MNYFLDCLLAGGKQLCSKNKYRCKKNVIVIKLSKMKKS